jgi:hypothetical protein
MTKRERSFMRSALPTVTGARTSGLLSPWTKSQVATKSTDRQMFCLRPDPAACPDEKASVQARSQSFLPVFQADLSPRLNEVKTSRSREEHSLRPWPTASVTGKPRRANRTTPKPHRNLSRSTSPRHFLPRCILLAQSRNKAGSTWNPAFGARTLTATSSICTR